MFKLSENSKRNREGVDPRLIEISDLAIQITAVDFGHPKDGGVRLAERQHELFLAGKSKCDGYEKISNHQKKKALDFFAYVRGKAVWDKGSMALVACAFFQAAATLGYRIRWGGFFKSRFDSPHIELIDDEESE